MSTELQLVGPVDVLRSKLNSCCFSLTDEDLIKHILADGQNFFPQADESEMADL